MKMKKEKKEKSQQDSNVVGISIMLIISLGVYIITEISKIVCMLIKTEWADWLYKLWDVLIYTTLILIFCSLLLLLFVSITEKEK